MSPCIVVMYRVPKKFFQDCFITSALWRQQTGFGLHEQFWGEIHQYRFVFYGQCYRNTQRRTRQLQVGFLLTVLQEHANRGSGFISNTKGHANRGSGFINSTKGHANCGSGFIHSTKGHANSGSGFINSTKGQANCGSGFINSTKGQANCGSGFINSTKGHANCGSRFY
jgi:hypothetical protein